MKAEKIKSRILNSLKLARTSQKLRWSKEFWYGFLVGLVDYKVITEEEYRNLRDMITSYKLGD